MHRSRRHGRSAALHRFSLLPAVLLAALAAVFATGASAASSISVGPSRISADQPLAPGRNYELPVHTVTNGSEANLRVMVTPSDFLDRERSLPAPEWFRAEPDQFVLKPGESRPVQVRALLPPDALPGSYRIWFRFHGEPEEAAGLVMATDVQVSFLFDVSRPPAFPRLSRPTETWGAAALLLAAIGALGWAVSRRRQPRHPEAG